MRSHRLFCACAAVLALCGVTAPAFAIDVMPGDYTLLPAGTTLGLLYLQHTSSDELKVDGVGKVPSSSLDTTVGIARVLHYSQIGNVPVAYQAFLPAGKLSNVRIGGAAPDVDDGIGDLTVGFTAFLAKPESAAKGTTVGLTAYVTAPTGQYDANKPSVGSGTWTFMPQLGIIHGFGNGWFTDLAADVSLQKDHREHGLQHKTDPSTQVQAYLRYQPTAVNSFSFGYSGLFGGDQDVGGVYTGQKTRSDSLRVFASHMMSPTFQVSGMLSSEVRSEGGFRDKYNVTLRLMKVF